MRLSLRKSAYAALSSSAWQEIRVREMAKVCALSAPGFLLGVFFGFGGFFFIQLLVLVIVGYGLQGVRGRGRLLAVERRWGGPGSGCGCGFGVGSAVIGGEAGSESAGLVACWEVRSAWVSSSSLCCSISARVGGLGRVMPILRFRIVIGHATVARLGYKFPSITSGSMAGRIARVLCMHASRPCVRVHSTRCGSLGAPVDSAWMHDGALPLRHLLQA